MRLSPEVTVPRRGSASFPRRRLVGLYLGLTRISQKRQTSHPATVFPRDKHRNNKTFGYNKTHWQLVRERAPPRQAWRVPSAVGPRDLQPLESQSRGEIWPTDGQGGQSSQAPHSSAHSPSVHPSKQPQSWGEQLSGGAQAAGDKLEKVEANPSRHPNSIAWRALSPLFSQVPSQFIALRGPGHCPWSKPADEFHQRGRGELPSGCHCLHCCVVRGVGGCPPLLLLQLPCPDPARCPRSTCPRLR